MFIRLAVAFIFTILCTHCASPKRLHMVVKMRLAQENDFHKNVLRPFEKSHNCKIIMQTYTDNKNLQEILDKNGDSLDLINMPLELMRFGVTQNKILALDKILTPEEGAEIKKEYFLTDLARIGGHTYFIPRQLETPLLIYSKAQVQEAVQFWENDRESIERVLVKANGQGLPKPYQLEKDPNEWDFYDLFVVGVYWRNKEIHGQKKGRIAIGSAWPQALMDMAYLSGAKPEEVMRLRELAIVDMFQWQSLFVREGIFPAMLMRENWGSNELFKAWQSGDIFLSFMSQQDFFWLHGNGTSEIPGVIKDLNDIGVARMPKGLSLMQEPSGKPLRQGGRNVCTRSTWWGVGAKSQTPMIAYELAHYLTSTKNQIMESSAYGIIPARQDLLGELGLMFGGGWMSDFFSITSQQLVENRFTLFPLVDDYEVMDRTYMEALQEFGQVSRNQKWGFVEIEKTLQEKYIPRLQSIARPVSAARF